MSFSNFGLKKTIQETVKELGFTQPTSIQTKVIPPLKKHQNLIALAHTGTGKTHAFLLPILNNLDFENANKVQALIIVPTRELGQQIYHNVKMFLKNDPRITANLFIGGTDLNRDLETLKKVQPMIVVGTPTRLKELYRQKALKLTTANYVVLDECDMIFDLDFLRDVDFLLTKINEKTTIAVFSATINEELRQFLKKYLPKALWIDDTGNLKTNKNLTHILIDTKNRDLPQTLKQVFQSLNPYLCLIFVNQKKDIGLVKEVLSGLKLTPVGELHGDLPPRTRATMVKKIKNHDFQYVIVSDLAARGLDIEEVSTVVSLNLPKNLNYYIHRAGRSGRKNTPGTSYVLMNLENQSGIEALKKQGIEFKVMKFVNNRLVSEPPKKSKPGSGVDVQSQMVINKYKNQPVKPGYKKKRRQELEKIKKNRRREHIKKSIAKIKKDKYRKRRKDIFED